MEKKQPKFKLGDVVILKSGGPEMTISEVKQSITDETFTGYYICVWFKDKAVQTGTFQEEILEEPFRGGIAGIFV
jgi:uncharacterized protein YodC (DUF2158 family)